MRQQDINPEDKIADKSAFDQSSSHLIDLLPCYVTVQDPSFRIIFANQTFKNDFGDKVGELCHVAYKKMPDICKSCPVKKTMMDKAIHFSEETVQTLDGGLFQMMVQSAPVLDDSGKINGVIEVATNITKIKEAQSELTMLGNSIALLSHGIKNILEGLQGGAYVVDEGIKDGDMKLASKGWHIVKKNITDITDVTKNILYTSKNRPLVYQKSSPIEIAKDSVALFQEKAESMGIELKHDINPKLPIVLLDNFSIRRLLNNLVWNALEACWRDKKKVPHTVMVKVDYYDEASFMFEVSDNGIGMDKATMNNIFEEFYSTKGSTGTGLGLAVVDNIINKHGGSREVESEPGEGSTFRVILKT